jgi:hypothetical protein
MKTRYIYKNTNNTNNIDTTDVNSVYDSISKNIPYEIGKSTDNIINNDNSHYIPHQEEEEEEEMYHPSIISELHPITNEDDEYPEDDYQDDDDYHDDEDDHNDEHHTYTDYNNDNSDNSDNNDNSDDHLKNHRTSKSTPQPTGVNYNIYNHHHTPIQTIVPTPTPTHMIQGHNGLINHLHHPYSTSKPTKSPNYGRLTKNTIHQGMYKYDPLEFKHPNRRTK